MVYITPLFSAVAILSSLNFAIALPQPGSDVSRQGGYGSGSSSGSNSGYNNNGYGSSNSGSSYGSSNSGSGYGSSNSGYGSSNSGYGSSNSGYGSSNSGYGSSNSGYGSSNSGYGSSNSGYGSSNSGYGSSNSGSGYGSSNSGSSNGYSSSDNGSMNSGTTTTSSTTSMMSETMTSMMSQSTSSFSTETAAASSTSIMYGSGSMNSGSSYNDCVAQCIASFAPSATSGYSSSNNNGNSGSSGSSGSTGTGATKTVIVAPTQGVFRFIPFAINASVGDTIQFMWGANNHTVTKSSALEPCNKSSDALFTSGEQNKGFIFTQVVNTTDTTFFFCNTPGHCQKGMFGVINPPSNLDAPTSVSGMMQSLKANNSNLNTYAAYTDQTTAGSAGARWGGNIDISSLPEWAQPSAAENVLYLRNLLAKNPELLKADGTVDTTSYGTTPWMYPQDVQDAAASTTPSTANAGAAAAGATSAAPATTTTSTNTNGASSTAPKTFVALLAVFATVLIL